jgi:segregation and condensation protein A
VGREGPVSVQGRARRGWYRRDVAVCVSPDGTTRSFEELAELVRSGELDLFELRLGELVERFRAEAAEVARLDLDEATRVALVAVWLLALKCRRLLPGDTEELEEALELLSDLDLLFARLLACRMYHAAGAALGRRLKEQAQSPYRPGGVDVELLGRPVPLPSTLTPKRLWSAYQAAVDPSRHSERPSVQLGHLLRQPISVAETAERLRAALPPGRTVRFRALAALVGGDRAEVVVAFLAVLELFKRGQVDLVQPAGEELVVVGVQEPAQPEWTVATRDGSLEASVGEMGA